MLREYEFYNLQRLGLDTYYKARYLQTLFSGQFLLFL